MKNMYLILLFRMCVCLVTCYALPIDEQVKQQTPTTVNYRLTRVVLPSKYELELKPFLRENELPNTKQFTFNGTVKITLKSSEDVTEITLHAKNLKNLKEGVTLVNETDKDNKGIVIKEVKQDPETDKLILTLEKKMPKDYNYVLTFKDFVGQMDDDMHGFYRSNYTRKNGTNVWIASTQFEPVHARRAFPCFDEPQFKAKFKVTINHDKLYSAISNTEIEKSSAEGDRMVTKFKETPIMSTYLLAFLVSDFKEVKDENDFKNLTVIAREDAENETKFALDIGKKLLKKLDNFTNLPYVDLGNPKMHLAAIPDFSAGAMENWGLLTFRERALLYTVNETTVSAEESIATVIAHEQAHMWFGDYVTCAWWNVTWLNEGFARYFQYYITHEVHPEWELDKQFVILQIQNVFVKDSLDDNHPLTNNLTNSPDQIGVMFDTITYNKGASVIRMIEHMLGKEKFKEALRSYFKDQKLSLNTALPEDLFRHFKSQWSNQNVSLDDIKHDWTEQVGYPVVTIQLSEDRKSFTVSQKRFVLRKDVQNSDLKYTIPLSYATNKKSDFQSTTPDLYITKDKNVTTVSLDEPIDWIVVNKLQTGYYRVNYDDNTWNLIHKALEKDDFSKIHEINRAQIVDDLLNFGRSGLIDYNRVLFLLDYLIKETNYLPWYAAFSGFRYVSNRLDQANNELFGKHILKITENIYKKLGFNQTNDESRLDTHNRAQVLKWACEFGNDDCIKNAKQYFDHLKNHKMKVPVNIRSVVYCTALREGNVTDFDFLWEKYKNETVATERTLILGSLGCPKSKEVVEKFLKYILSPDVRRQDKSTAFSSTYSSNPGNPQIVFDFIKSNLDQVQNVLGSYSDVAAVISNVASRFTTNEQKNQLQQFYDQNKDKFGNAAQTLYKSLKNVNDNLKWSEEKLPSFLNFLNVNYNSAKVTSFSFILITFVTVFVMLFVF